MPTHQFNHERLQQLEELLDIVYEKQYEFERAIQIADGGQKIALQRQLKRDILPDLEKYEREYAELLSAGFPDSVPEKEAGPLVMEIAKATQNAQAKQVQGAPEEMVRLLEDIKKRLDEPGKSASAKLKVCLPIIPLISHYELELDTENFVTTIWRKVRLLVKKWMQ